MTIDVTQLRDIEVDGIDPKDYPDFSDAFIASACWLNGDDLTDEEIDELNDDYRDFVYDTVFDGFITKYM